MRHATQGTVLLGPVLLMSWACGGAEPPPPPAPPEVGVSQPITRPVTQYAEFTGTTRGSESVQIRARVTGTLEQVAFVPGRPVHKGDLLFVIEPRPYKAARDSAAAALRAAEADLARTESDLGRVTQAVKTNAVSESDVDLARAQRDMAEANVLSGKANLDQAELQLSYTRVLSPINGMIDRNLFDVGNVVGGPGEDVLTSVNRVVPLFVYFDAPEQAVLEILRRRQMGILTRDDEPSLDETDSPGEDPVLAIEVSTTIDEGFPHVGAVDFVSNKVDASTGTIEIRGRLPNEEELLFAGLFVGIRLPIGTVDDAILIDERALGTDLGGRYVYVVGADDVVEQRYVRLGPVEDDGMVPVVEGLELSDTYIVEGVLRTRPGMPVTPMPVESTE